MKWEDDNLLKKFREMSATDRDISYKLLNATDNIVNHLIKLFYLETSQSRNHWMNEIWGPCNRVPNRKANNKLPTFEFIYSKLFGYVDDDRFEEYFNLLRDALAVNYDEELSCEMFNKEDYVIFLNFCREYFKWLSNKLSTRGSVSLLETKNKLCELCNKF